MTTENMKLNGEWCKHARRWLKKMTSKYRRVEGKKILRKEYKNFI